MNHPTFCSETMWQTLSVCVSNSPAASVPLPPDLPWVETASWNSLRLSWNGDYWHGALGSAPCPVEPRWPLRDGEAHWLISWPGSTTTPPLAGAYGAACPMDSCVCNTHPRCCLLCACRCVRECPALFFWSIQHVLLKQGSSASCLATWYRYVCKFKWTGLTEFTTNTFSLSLALKPI